MNKKILNITYDGVTDHLGQSQVLSYLKKAYENVIEVLDAPFRTSPENIRNIAKKYFSLDAGAQAYHSVYQKLENY